MAENPNELQPRRTRADGRETAQKILKYAEQELTSAGLVNFNLDRVIEASGVSRSSVYHHFGGREGVIAAAEAEFLRETLFAGLSEMEQILLNVSSGEEAFALVEIGVLISGSDDQKELRRRRISTLAITPNSPATKKIMSEWQSAGTKRFAQLIRNLKNKGFCYPVEPIDGIAHLIQSMLLGRVLVDILDDPTAEAEWAKSASATLRLLLRPTL